MARTQDDTSLPTIVRRPEHQHFHTCRAFGGRRRRLSADIAPKYLNAGLAISKRSNRFKCHESARGRLYAFGVTDWHVTAQ